MASLPYVQASGPGLRAAAAGPGGLLACCSAQAEDIDGTARPRHIVALGEEDEAVGGESEAVPVAEVEAPEAEIQIQRTLANLPSEAEGAGEASGSEGADELPEPAPLQGREAAAEAAEAAEGRGQAAGVGEGSQGQRVAFAEEPTKVSQHSVGGLVLPEEELSQGRKVVSTASMASQASKASALSSGGSASGSSSRRLLGRGLRSSLVGSTQIRNSMLKSTLSFGGCRELLRGSPLSEVMRRQGRIFVNSAGSAETYKLSRTVKCIDAFLSHNWSVPRWEKFIALATFYNTWWAGFLTLLCLLPLAVPSALGLLPVVELLDGPPRGVVCRLVGPPLFLFFFVFCRDILRRFGRGGPTVFLDKTCIHQTDKAVQQQGIARLGAFLVHSELMVVLYTDVYLHKLWTIYEVASFLSLHDTSKMKVIHTFAPRLFCSALVLVVLATWASIVGEATIGFLHIWVFTVAAATLPLSFICRRWAYEGSRINEKLRSFTVHDARCFVEDDRAFIYKSIAALIRETHNLEVPAPTDGSTDQAALDQFDQLVRQELPVALIRSMGPFALNWRQMILVTGITRLAFLLDTLASLAYGSSGKHILMSIVWEAVFVFGGYPLVVFIIQKLVSYKLHWRGALGVLWVLFVQLLGAFAGMTIFVVGEVISSALPMPLSLVGFAFLFLIVILCCLLLRRGCRRGRGRGGLESSSSEALSAEASAASEGAPAAEPRC